MSRRQLIVGNWKMNGLMASLDVAKAIATGAGTGSIRVICPPTTLIAPIAAALRGSLVAIGGQDCHTKSSGAYTGDVSATMLADAGARYVIIGHSERRSDHGETNALVCEKAHTAMAAGLIVIVCVGESEAQRDAGQAESVVIAQVAASIPPGSKSETLCIAYEPVWAIGTGRTPSMADVEAMHGAIRTTLRERFGVEEGEAIAILYGGSVNPANAQDLLSIANVDGALVGGASLKAESFLSIGSV
jgi:triosephosphate isomerase (TIM)